jgi:phosphoribosylamine--glycine ligase
MLRLESDLVGLLTAAVEGRLEEEPPAWTGDAALAVVLASKGYPGRYETGTPIGGLATLGGDGLVVFHAATAERAGDLVATGGRVLTVAARAATAAAARAKVYGAIGRIDWPGGFCRSDIGAVPSG